jgi:crossover junction endodeoxyribonuclease RusA
VLTFFVPGRCAPQGSKRSVGRGRFVEASKYLPAWRKAITEFAIYAATEHSWDTIEGPVELHVTFYLDRPASIPMSKRPFPIVPPDVDKLVRAIGDGVTDAGVWGDDSQVVSLIARKLYSDGHEPGALITIRRHDIPPDSQLML